MQSPRTLRGFKAVPGLGVMRRGHTEPEVVRELLDVDLFR